MSKTIKQIREAASVVNPFESKGAKDVLARTKKAPRMDGTSPQRSAPQPKTQSVMGSSQNTARPSGGGINADVGKKTAGAIGKDGATNMSVRDLVKGKKPVGWDKQNVPLSQKKVNSVIPKTGDKSPSTLLKPNTTTPADVKAVAAGTSTTHKAVAHSNVQQVQALKPGETLKDKGPTTSIKATTQTAPAQKTAPTPAPATAAKPAAPSSRPAPAAPRQSAPQKSSWGFHGTKTSTMRKGASTQSITNASLGGVYEDVKPQIKESFEQFLRNTFLKG